MESDGKASHKAFSFGTGGINNLGPPAFTVNPTRGPTIPEVIKTSKVAPSTGYYCISQLEEMKKIKRRVMRTAKFTSFYKARLWRDPSLNG